MNEGMCEGVLAHNSGISFHLFLYNQPKTYSFKDIYIFREKNNYNYMSNLKKYQSYL